MIASSDNTHMECVAAVRPNGERYVFFWQPKHAEVLFRTFARFAADESLSFSWTDANAMAHSVQRRLVEMMEEIA